MIMIILFIYLFILLLKICSPNLFIYLFFGLTQAMLK
jgi:hypothetical protein